ncbi:urease accessory protein UreD, partial [Paenibacillus koleovorans]|uniref:urease accessory protein UreD n=1 Tax=Paenibacillus koleovorans TaxID=121608 RepID=UPI0013E31683
MLGKPAALQAKFIVAPNGKTQLAESFARAPLKLAKTFEQPGGDGQAGVIVMDCSPGLMAGDVYEQAWWLEPGASVKIGSQSFTKVHPSDGRASRQRLRFRVERDGCLEWLPQPLMLYADARLHSECMLELGDGAVAALTEIVCPGRSLRGESFQYGLYDSRFTVSRAAGGEVLYRGRQRWEPARQRLASPAVWGEFTHIGTLWVFADRLRPAHAELLHEAAARLERPSEPRSRGVSSDAVGGGSGRAGGSDGAAGG